MQRSVPSCGAANAQNILLFKPVMMHVDAVTNLHAITLKQLRYFVVVAEVQNFRKASDLLNMSQPPLSQQIKSLELTLGVELFDRRAKKIVLTLAGEEFLKEAKSLLADLEDAVEHARAIGRGERGVIRLGITTDFIYHPLISQIEDFCKQHSDLPIELYVNVSSTLLEMLTSHELDFLLSVPAPERAQGDLHDIALPASQIIALVPEHHKFADQTELSLTDLHGAHLIDFPEDSRLPIAIKCRRAFADYEVRAHVKHVTTSSSLASVLVARGAGIALASEYSIPPEVPGVIKLPIVEKLELDHRLIKLGRHAHPALEDLITILSEKDR